MSAPKKSFHHAAAVGFAGYRGHRRDHFDLLWSQGLDQGRHQGTWRWDGDGEITPQPWRYHGDLYGFMIWLGNDGIHIFFHHQYMDMWIYLGVSENEVYPQLAIC